MANMINLIPGVDPDKRESDPFPLLEVWEKGYITTQGTFSELRKRRSLVHPLRKTHSFQYNPSVHLVTLFIFLSSHEVCSVCPAVGGLRWRA